MENSSISFVVQASYNPVVIGVTFNTSQNFQLGSAASFDYLCKSIKFKITSKIANAISNRNLSISTHEDATLAIYLSFTNANEIQEPINAELNEVPDEGAIFLPYGASLNHAEAEEISILIVDDIEFNLSVLRNILESICDNCKCGSIHRKYRIHAAKSGAQAIEMVKQQDLTGQGYLVIIMDCLMPEMDGWETTVCIRNMHRLKEIEGLPNIIAYSAFDSKEDVEKSKNSGMCDHISKPCVQEDLCRTISRWTEKRLRRQTILQEIL